MNTEYQKRLCRPGDRQAQPLFYARRFGGSVGIAEFSMVLCKIFVNSSVLSPVISSAIMGIVTESAAHGADMCRAEGKRGVHMTVTEEIQALKKEKNAVILAHYYVRPEVQEIADYTGDSFYLSKIATGLEEQTIVFCGVSFMGESAKILNPEKTVLMPDARADCAMAHMADEECIRRAQESYDDVAVVCYINSTAELKRHSDVCVTSSNAVRIVKALPNRNIFFIPDTHLAHFVAEQVPEKHFLFHDGYCPVHQQMQTAQIRDAKAAHPKAQVLAHPECPKAVLDLADYVGSTSGIIRYARESGGDEFIICTENGVRAALEKENPEKRFYFTETEPVCEDMKRITLEKIRHVFMTGDNEVRMDARLMEEAKAPLTEMLRLGD